MARGMRFRSRRGLGMAIAALVVVLATSCTAPAHKEGAPWHHTTAGFRNPPGSPERNPWWKRMPWVLSRMLLPSEKVVVPPDHVLPRDAMQAMLRANAGGDSLTWIGHMATLLRLDGINVLTDPWMTEYASPLPPFGAKRYVPPGLAIADLPPIDVVVISHSHFDHLDLPTLDALPDRGRITAVVPLGLGHYFRERGFGRVVELDWHESVHAHGLTFTAMPVIHWSKRSFFAENDTLWSAFAIESRSGLRVYFGGDAEYGPVYRENAARYGRFDVALLSIGAFLPRRVMDGAHCTPADCLKIGLEFGAHTMVGLHWGTGPLGGDAFDLAPRLFREAAATEGIARERIWIMKIGETRTLARRPD